MKIQEYKFGRLTLDGTVYSADVIILPDRVITNWWRLEGHSLAPEDLGDVITAGPDKLIIGTGAYGRMQVPQATLDFLQQHGIEPVTLPSGEACDLFNSLSAGGHVAAALHLTC